MKGGKYAFTCRHAIAARATRALTAETSTAATCAASTAADQRDSRLSPVVSRVATQGGDHHQGQYHDRGSCHFPTPFASAEYSDLKAPTTIIGVKTGKIKKNGKLILSISTNFGMIFALTLWSAEGPDSLPPGYFTGSGQRTRP